MKVCWYFFPLAICVVAGSAQSDALAAPSGSSAKIDPIAGKCAGLRREGCTSSTRATQSRALPSLQVDPEPEPTETLASSLDAAYHTAPSLAAARYELRATDEDYALALAELHPSSALDVTGSYSKTVPGRTTQAARFGAVSPIITSNTLSARLTVDQPLYTGGRAAADRGSALAAIDAARAQLRGGEDDLFLQVITAYADIRRDADVLRLRAANLKQLTATLDEVKARREAGELTRTDIAQAQAQLSLAQAQFNLSQQQHEADRAVFAELVGHQPGVLAPAPPLPHLPPSIDAAFDIADSSNPDLAQAIATERASRERIAAARAQGRPSVSVRGSATLTGQAAPYSLANEDQIFDGQLALTIPIGTGGRVRALVAQAQDRNAADSARVELAHRRLIAAIVDSWNAIATGQRNVEVGQAQLTSARVFDEGTFEEYRAGLRSTFDVLYAHQTLRDAEIALINARHDTYLAQATLLRQIGLLEARSVLAGAGLHDPQVNFDDAASRADVPWAGALRALDRVGRPRPRPIGVEQPPASDAPVQVRPSPEQVTVDVVHIAPAVPAKGAKSAPIPTGTPSSHE